MNTLTRHETLEFVQTMRSSLSKRAIKVLEKMRVAHDAENYEEATLVYDKQGGAWLGTERVSKRVLDELICAVVIHAEGKLGGALERYTLNSDGRDVLAENMATG